jgi:hypothetical protein
MVGLPLKALQTYDPKATRLKVILPDFCSSFFRNVLINGIFPALVNRKWISIAFYRTGVEAELRERPGMINTPISSYNGFDELFPIFEKLYVSEGFPHVPGKRCALYKCLYFFVIDAIWTINFPICAAPVQVRHPFSCS